MFTWLKNLWTKFENFCASLAPGFKTFILAFVGGVGSLAAAFQDYLTGVPLDKFVTTQEVLYINLALFTLVFFTRYLTNVSVSKPAA